MALWNKKELEYPPISSYPTSDNSIDLLYFSNVCKEARDAFSNNKYLDAELLLLSRLIYRMKSKFRTSKDFRYIEGVSKRMKKFVNVIPHKGIETLLGLIPQKYYKVTYLPSKNLVDFVLVRLQSVGKLLKYTRHLCIQAARHLDIRIQTGHFWKIGLFLYAVISRINVLIRYFLITTCNIYRKLRPFSTKLKSTSKWLPDDYNLPIELEEWLDINWEEFDKEIEISDEPDVTIPFFRRFNDDDDDDQVEFCDEYILINDDAKSKKQKRIRGFNFDDDFGVEVETDDQSEDDVEEVKSEEDVESINSDRGDSSVKETRHESNNDAGEIMDSTSKISISSDSSDARQISSDSEAENNVIAISDSSSDESDSSSPPPVKRVKLNIPQKDKLKIKYKSQSGSSVLNKFNKTKKKKFKALKSGSSVKLKKKALIKNNKKSKFNKSKKKNSIVKTK